MVVSTAHAGDDARGFSLEIEGVSAWQARNDVRSPGDSGTLFSLVDLGGKGPFFNGRVYLNYSVNPRHEFRLLYAPLSIQETGSLRTPVSFAGTVFDAGKTTGTYRFDSYRLTDRYRFYSGPNWSWKIGFTGKIRDAGVRLSQGTRTASEILVRAVDATIFNWRESDFLERRKTMNVQERMKRNWAVFATAFFLMVSIIPVAGVSQDAKGKQDLDGIHTRLVKEVRHELVMLPFYSLFDNLAFRIEGVDTIVLMGQVTRPTLKQDAENVVRKIEAVGKVVNDIEVLPLSPNDDRIRRAAYRAIYSRAGLDRYALSAVPSIHIIVKNGNITLEGVVANQMDKDLAGIAAKGVSGAFTVTDNLKIESK